MDLVILAGGMGSRFGGAKQVEGIDSNNNFIMDYSIFDAISANFDRMVVIIKREHRQIFDETLTKRIKNKTKLVYVYQDMDENALSKFNITRTKPLGTGHAILCTKNVVKDNFCIVNADDFYGKNSFKIASDFMQNIDKSSTQFGLVGYILKNTMSETGAVKRGICQIKNGNVSSIEECSVEYVNGKPIAHILRTNEEQTISGEEIASMNMFCLTPQIFPYLQKEYEEFISIKENLESGEFLLPRIIDKMVSSNLATLKLLKTDEKWIGMTYKDDKESVCKGIAQLVKIGRYPNNLWK